MNVITQALTYTLFLPMLFGCGGGTVQTATLNTKTQIANANYIIQSVDGEWSAMGVGFAGTAAMPGTINIRAIAIAPNGMVYAGGREVVTADGGTVYNIAQWDGVSWTAMGSGFNERVTEIAVASNGDVYACGFFTLSGAGTVNRVARWDGTAWNALGAGLNNDVWDMAIDSQNNVYVCGVFGTAGTIAAAKVAKWDGTAWSAMGAGLNNTGQIMVADLNDNIYVTGMFGTAGTIAADTIAKWDGSAWSALSGDTILHVSGGMAVDNLNRLWLSARNDDAEYHLYVYDGANIVEMADTVGLSANLYFDKYRNLIYSCSPYFSARDGVSVWNGSAWSALNVDLPGAAIAKGMAFDDRRIFVGYDTFGTAVTSGTATSVVTNSGSADSYPIITLKRTGGTSATLYSVTNRTTGDELLFNWSIQNGEEIVIDLTPGRKTITSSFTGNAISKLLPQSDIGTWRLVSGTNNIGLFILDAGSPTLTAYIQWEELYQSADG